MNETVISVKEIIYKLFNNNKGLYNRLKPSKEEVIELENFEWRTFVDNGIKNINGGYIRIKVYDGDAYDLFLNVECGEEDAGSGNKNWWRVKYDRKTKKFEEI